MILKPSLQNYGILSPKKIIYNPGYDDLFIAETSPNLDKCEAGTITTLGAVAIDTGEFTGRSPKDKYIVATPQTLEDIWWNEEGSDNKKLSVEAWVHLKNLTTTQLTNKTLYVIDGFCGANLYSRLSIRLVTEVAWMAHFF